MAKKVEIKAVGKYGGHNVKDNKSVDLTLKMDYSELTKTIQCTQLLNENVTIAVKVGEEKPKTLGMFMIKTIGIDSDGETKIKFNTLLDYIEENNLKGLAGELLKIKFSASIDVEDGDEEGAA